MNKNRFKINNELRPAGQQPQVIAALVKGIRSGMERQTLLGVTGSGKTLSMAHVIAKTQKPTLIISHNKTLAAQLAGEFKEFFPDNAVEYFVSYYDYYQPEAYLPASDTYIAKDASINEEIDRLRHATLKSVLTRRDALVVASVSCIYGLGQPADYFDRRVVLKIGARLERQEFLRELSRLQYSRNDIDLVRGTWRVRGDVVDVFPAGEENILRVEFFGSQIERLTKMDLLTGEVLEQSHEAEIFPATFFMGARESWQMAKKEIRKETKEQIKMFEKQHKLIEAQRIRERVTYDLEMIEQVGYVSGIENYSRFIDGRDEGEPPATLMDYFRYAYGDDWLVMVDESHMSIPQIGGMHGGDAARKENLIRFGWRLPSAKDNRPLKFNEFEDRLPSTIFVSATPGPYESNVSDQVVEQVVRPTGLLDPQIEVRSANNQVDDVIDEIRIQINKNQRVLVTTLTKRMAEELSTYLIEMGIKAAYLHSDVVTLDRLDILRDLRLGKYDVLVGINLLREGLDLPEVSLVSIMDADKEGYLRSSTALIQTMGRAARHLEGRVIMYADKVTGSMKVAMDESARRRVIQASYNKKHNITPQSIRKAVRELRLAGQKPIVKDQELNVPADERERAIKELKNKMELASSNLEFERAAKLRDMIKELRSLKRQRQR